MLVRNPMAPVRIESIDCEVEIAPGRKVAAIESVRLASDTVEPGQDLKAFVTLKPFKGEREIVEIVLPIPADFPEGTLRGGLLRHGQQPPPPVPQRAAAGRAARPGRVHAGHPHPDRAQADRDLRCTSPLPSAAWPSRARNCPTSPAASGPPSPRRRRSPPRRSAPT